MYRKRLAALTRTAVEEAASGSKKRGKRQRGQTAAEQEQPAVVKIDLSKLDQIRRDAEATMERLAEAETLLDRAGASEVASRGEGSVREASFDEGLSEVASPGEESVRETLPSEAMSGKTADGEAGELPAGLMPEEYRLLQCLLYGREYHWVREEGRLLSVLVDAINGKLYDIVSDTVLEMEDAPKLVEDYLEELKNLIHP